jgi:glutaminyl-peptide cyclotransferase
MTAPENATGTRRAVWIASTIAAVITLAAGGAMFAHFQQRDQFAQDRAPADAPAGDEKPVAFDAKRAMGYLEDVCKIGPRISGSDGMKKQQELIEKHFAKYDGKVTYQKFRAKQRSRPLAPVDMANIVVSYFPAKKDRIILCSHYDTRPIADQEERRGDWEKPFVSANDGGSGVALMMELAHHMKGIKTNLGVDFVFFDGEEYIFAEDDKYFFGSKHFGEAYKKQRAVKYKGAVLLDMVAGKGATFPMERNSLVMANKLVKEVWGIAKELKVDRFTNGLSKTEVLDDHIALNNAGIPAIDVIDFDYPHGHKLTDVPKNCSAETMAEVAKVCSVWLQRAK